ncbi:hypothetical protein [Haloarcula halophila]|uniref:hypothetical protein n=1 Tax=Haloarcula TaxID=2237 RepID=UPI0023E3FF67|nr:hypothetical protein [Halomicroarcula sp. DFY41]
MFRLDSLEATIKPFEVLTAQISITSVAALWVISPGEPVSLLPFLGTAYVAHSVHSRHKEAEAWVGNDEVEGAKQ